MHADLGKPEALAISRRRVGALAGLLFAIAVPVSLILLLRGNMAIEPLPIPTRLPRIVLTDLHGNDVSLESHRGKKLAVLFFTTSCAHCRKELTNFEVLYRRHNSAMTFLAVSLSDRAQTISLMEQQRFSFPVYHDSRAKAGELLRIRRVPALLIIDEQGVLRHRRFGEASLQADEQLILAFLNETTAVQPQ